MVLGVPRTHVFMVGHHALVGILPSHLPFSVTETDMVPREKLEDKHIVYYDGERWYCQCHMASSFQPPGRDPSRRMAR
jgi:hypothetical protein